MSPPQPFTPGGNQCGSVPDATAIWHGSASACQALSQEEQGAAAVTLAGMQVEHSKVKTLVLVYRPPARRGAGPERSQAPTSSLRLP